MQRNVLAVLCLGALLLPASAHASFLDDLACPLFGCAVGPPPRIELNCQSLGLEGQPQFRSAPPGTAAYRFRGVCSNADHSRSVVYEIDAAWVPSETDPARPNASEIYRITSNDNLSPDHRPQAGGAYTEHVIFSARCDRDPWLRPGTCRRVGDTLPTGVRETWPDIATARFPNTREAIPLPQRRQLLTAYNAANGIDDPRLSAAGESRYGAANGTPDSRLGTGMNARHGAAYIAQAQGNTMAKRNSREPGTNHGEATSNVMETSLGQGPYVEERATSMIYPSADVNAIAPTRSNRDELDAAVKREEEKVAALREEMEQINDRSDFDKFMGGLFGSDAGAGEVGRKTERSDKPVYNERDQRSAPSVGTSPRYGASASSDETQAAMERANAEIVKMKEKTERDQPGIDVSLGELQGEQSGLAAAKVTKTSLGNGLTVGDRFGKDGTKALLGSTTQTGLDASTQVHVEPPPTSTTYRPVTAAAALGGASPPSAASAPLPPIAAPAVVFSPPLLEDNAQLWACADAAAGEANAGACSGEESAQAYCRLRDAESGPDLLIADAQPDIPVRAVNGDACVGETCRVVSQLQCGR